MKPSRDLGFFLSCDVTIWGGVLFHRVHMSPKHCDPAYRKGQEEAEGNQLLFWK